MFALRLLWRDWRGGELGILASSIVLAVAIVTGISLFADRLQQGIVAQSSSFLAADRVLQSPAPVDNLWLQQAEREGLQQAEILSFQSMVYAGEEVDATMQLTSVKAVSNHYPLRGQLEVSDEAFGSSIKTTASPPRGEVWLDPRLLPLMNLEIGDALYVGEAKLLISKVVVNEPDRGGNGFVLGARVLMNIADIPATDIVQPGSLVEYRYLFAGEADALSRYGEWVKGQMQPSHKWLNLKDTQPGISQSLQRAEQFLLLAGALGVGLAGIAIALAARRYSERHYDYVAIMKSLGATSARVMRIYIGNLLLLATIALLVGCAFGWLIQEMFILILQDYFDVTSTPEITLRPFIIGSVTALVCLLAFALPPLLSLQGTSPLRVLRRDLPNSGLGNVLTYGIGVSGIGLLMFWYSGNLTLTMAVLAGVGLTFVIVGVFAWYLLRGTARVGMQAGSSWRLALASMRRRGFQNAVQSVIFSLAIMLLLLLALIRSSLIEEWQVQLPEGTPNHFLVNVAKHEVTSLRTLLATNQLETEPIYPMVRGRLTRVNDETVAKRASRTDPTAQNSLDRELSLSWSKTLPNDNIIVEGEWWSEGSTAAEVSMEKNLAQRLQINTGDKMEFLIGSERLVVTVTSIRELDWDTMKPNFYMLFPPGLLNQYPATYMTSFYLPSGQKHFLNQFLREFPTITVIEMDSVIKQIRSIITQVSSAVELVLGLIIVSGLLVLIASVQASLDSRYQESAVLRTLGAKRELVLGSLVIEFSSLGLLAGFLAAFSAELSVYGLQEYLLRMDYVFHPWVWLVGPLFGAILIGIAGYVTCRKVVNTPPVEVLREI
ncbi:MAG: FtsX-like permease family protein [Oceanicoccus sp.]|uniref:ABC transporter permease n=1 Tax=Oceanicoccus sp. TaxID=2691044 RepID=UPI0026181A33|nr:FtsX-like permease family protein [Oceanicoccus sp.]MCP3907319.1 FtsX-like permease family protein [Oceanicoccus sp.]